MDGDTVEICGEAPLAGPSSPWGIGATLAGSRTALTQLRLYLAVYAQVLAAAAAAAAVGVIHFDLKVRAGGPSFGWRGQGALHLPAFLTAASTPLR